MAFALPCEEPPVKLPAPVPVLNPVPLWQAMYAPQSLATSQVSDPSVVPNLQKQDPLPSEPVSSRPVQEQHKLTCTCNDSGTYQVVWHVERRQLALQDKQIASPSFLISFGNGLPEASCKLVLHSKGPSFQKARGHGQIGIKCETILPETASQVSARFIVGTGRKQQPARGPALHDFAESATCGLPKGEDDWDMRASVQKTMKTVAIRVEITPVARF